MVTFHEGDRTEWTLSWSNFVQKNRRRVAQEPTHSCFAAHKREVKTDYRAGDKQQSFRAHYNLSKRCLQPTAPRAINARWDAGKTPVLVLASWTARIRLNIRQSQHCLGMTPVLGRETVTRENSCCGPSLSLSRDSARFYLLFFLMAIYMLAGAAMFSILERPAELLAHRLWEKRLKDFTQGHNITLKDLKSLLSHYEEARTAGIRTEQGRALWDIPGAFYFVGTVVSTIGESLDCCPCHNKVVFDSPPTHKPLKV